MCPSDASDSLVCVRRGESVPYVLGILTRPMIKMIKPAIKNKGPLQQAKNVLPIRPVCSETLS